MSLLMDALRRAEEAKRRTESDKAEDRGGSSAGSDGPGKRLREQASPGYSTRLELLEEAPEPTRRQAAGAPDAADERARQAIENVFAVKRPNSRRPFYLAVGVLTLAAVAGIGAYFWWQLRPASPLAAPALSGARPPAAIVAAQPGLPAAPQTPELRTSPSPATAKPDRLVPEQHSAPGGAMSRETRSRQPSETERENRRRASADDPERMLRLSPGAARVNPALEQAYQAFQAGNVSAAKAKYEQVIRSEPKNLDALLGLAAIAIEGGRPEVAEDYYLRALEADPKDGTAQAGLLALRGPRDPVQAESRIKTLLASQPDSPALHFALGNAYAAQSRWHEAQQAYFRAYSGDSENGDYLYNLAVSLDQLQQPGLALQYYQAALSAAARRPAGFNRDQANARVRELQQ